MPAAFDAHLSATLPLFLAPLARLRCARAALGAPAMSYAPAAMSRSDASNRDRLPAAIISAFASPMASLPLSMSPAPATRPSMFMLLSLPTAPPNAAVESLVAEADTDMDLHPRSSDDQAT